MMGRKIEAVTMVHEVQNSYSTHYMLYNNYHRKIEAVTMVHEVLMCVAAPDH